MKDKINGRTPEEIKKGLDCCIYETDDSSLVDHCRVCPYQPTGLCIRTLLKDALAYIQQIERERDAAVEQLKDADTIDLFYCSHCKHEQLCDYNLNSCEDCEKDCPCHTCVDMCNWQWRGVPEEVE